MVELPIARLRDHLRRREVRAREVVEESLARIERLDPSLNAFLRATPELGLRAAEAADAAMAAGTAPPLSGVPMGVKDVLCLEGVECTAGSRILKGFVPPYTATTVGRALDAGATPVGKTNCDEFAMGSS